MTRPVPNRVKGGYKLQLYTSEWVNTELVNIDDYAKALAIGIETLAKEGELDLSAIRCKTPKKPK